MNIKKQLRFWLIFTCIGVASKPVFSQVMALHLQDSLLHKGIPILIEHPYTLYFEDKTAAYALHEVIDSQFLPRLKSRFHLGYEHKNIWLQFKILNQSQAQQFIIEVVNPFIPGLKLYQTNHKRHIVQEWATGVDSTFSKRPRKHRNFQFPVRIVPGDSSIFYLSVAQDYLPNFNLLISEKNAREDDQQRFEDVLLTIFFVFCTLYLLLTAILLSVTKQFAPWYYFIYVLLTAFFIEGHLGMGYRYLWKDYPAFQYIIPEALNIFRLIFGLQFFRIYFELPTQAKTLNKIINVTILFFLITPLIQLVYTQIRTSTGMVQGGMWYGKLVYFGYAAFCAYLMVFSAVLFGWVIREMLVKRRGRTFWVLLVVGLNFIGLATISLQYLGFDTLDVAADLMGWVGKRSRTFFIPSTVMLAFFVEMVLVFYFSIRKYIRLLEKNQKIQAKLAQTRAEGLNALVMGVENERRRIARDLHDGACVDLVAIRMKLDALRTQIQETTTTEVLENICKDLEQTYQEVRGISHDLMSKALEKTDLLSSLEELVQRAQQAQPGLRIQFYHNTELDQTVGLAKIQIYRIVQELMGNVLKHANARQVSVQLLQDQDHILLTIEDDGCGFDPAQAPMQSEGIGLANVRTRVDVLRGQFLLESAAGKGTFVHISVPKSSLDAVL